METIAGRTEAERAAQRAQRTRSNRAAEYARRMRSAGTPSERLSRACEYMRAVAKGMQPEDVDNVARDLTRIADEWNLR